MRKDTVFLIFLFLLVLTVGCQGSHHTGHDADDYPWSIKHAGGFPNEKVINILDDFETGTRRWTQRGDGSLGCTVERTTDAAEGKYAAEINFYGNRTKGAKKWPWFNVFWYIDGGGWPKEGKYLTFWGKAAKPTKIMLNIHEGPPRLQNEFFGYTVELTSEWKKYKIPADQFTEYIWGHNEGNKKLDLGRSILVGICMRHDKQNLTFPATFKIDSLYIEKE